MGMDIIRNFELEIGKLVHRFKEELSGIRGGRPTTKLVENITIDYLNQKLTVKQVGSISLSLPREIHISTWDPGATSNLSKAIDAALNVASSVEGNLVRVTLPALSEERRNELAKLVKKEAEETRIKIRALRDDYFKKIKREEDDGEISEDEKFRLRDRLQKNIDSENKEIEEALENKIREIQE